MMMGYHVLQRLTLNIVQHIIRCVVLIKHVVYFHDMLVVKASDSLCLLNKLAFLMGKQIAVRIIAHSDQTILAVVDTLHEQFLNGDLVTQNCLHGQVGDSETTLPENLLDFLFTILERRSLM